jgi:hypothetical protein
MTPPSNGELWHLSIDDLLGPLPETFRLGGSGPFVINLRASNMSMNPIANVLEGFDDLHLYQIQRIEDDVQRFRLRLGPFTSEEAADAVLLKVRDRYPCALTATAVADDLQAIELLQRPKEKTPAAPASAAQAPAAEPAIAAPEPAAVQPPPASRVIASAAAAVRLMPAVPSAAIAPAPRTPTAAEGSAQSLRWFVIELSVTDHAVDPETVPNLDIYDLYRLYSVTEVIEGRCIHALRLGFFGEEIAAKAVASYLAGYYDKPTIKRVSVAERERFSQQGIEARKDVGATGMHAVIEITGDRHARPVRKTVSPPP